MDDVRSGAKQPAPAAPATATTASSTATHPPKVVQPKPQALPSRSGPSSILVSPRQKGNPILNGVRRVAWEYSDIPADYVLGATTCALFLSLKYHRLHPEYIYNRIRDLRGQYDLRILLTMVDIENHEESLRELSKTSLINNVTIMLCWSAQEAGHYLELFKTFEHAAPTSIRAQQSSSHYDKMVDFITVPRSINKTDAIGLVSNFGSIRTAVNAGPEEVGLIGGWGEKKVQRWCHAVRDPFRLKIAAKRGGSPDRRARSSTDVARAEARLDATSDVDPGFAARLEIGGPVPVEADLPVPGPPAVGESDADRRPLRRPAERDSGWAPGQEEEEAMRQAEAVTAITEESRPSKASRPRRKERDEGIDDDDIMAALAKLRQE